MRTVEIYALYEPNQEVVRYIGKSVNSNRRLKEHIKMANDTRHKDHKHCWIRSLLKRGEYPRLVIIDIIPELEWEFWERYYISLYKSWGFDLTNICEGGEGNKGVLLDLNTRERISQAMKDRWKKDPDKIRNCIGAIQGRSIECTHIDGSIKVFISISQAGRELNLSHKKIQDVLKGRRRNYQTYKNWTFKYL